MRRRKKVKRVGLALGAGAARGTAHLGVLQAIDELDIPVKVVAGTSIGSLVGAVYASGGTARLRDTLTAMDWKEILYYFFEVSLPKSGLVDGKRVVDFIEQFIEEREIGDLPMPYRAVATDVMSGEEVVLSEGPLIESIRASISMPGVFTPVMKDGRVLVDGGLVNPVPVSVVREMGADFVIAVDINANRVGAKDRATERALEARREPPPVSSSAEDLAWQARISEAVTNKLGKLDLQIRERLMRKRKEDPMPNIVDVLGNTIRIMEAQIGESMLQISKPDVVIRPDVGHISFLEFNRAEEGMVAGYEAAMPLLEEALNSVELVG